MKNHPCYPSLKRITEGIVLLSSGLFLSCILYARLLIDLGNQERLVFPWFVKDVFYLLIATLLVNILLQIYHATVEGTSLLEECPDNGDAGIGCEYRTHRQGTVEQLLSCCRNFLDDSFSRFSSFQQFRASHLFFCYFAKRRILSLFSMAWIETGFVFLLPIVYADTVDFGIRDVSAETGPRLFLLIALCFWLPGVLIRFFRPYQKLWLCLTQEGGTLYIRITCRSPLRKAKLNRLLTSANQALDHQEGPGLVSSSTQSR